MLAGVALAAMTAALETLKRDPAFCAACHLPDGATLHAAKNRLFREPPPRDLAAWHRAKKADFSCIECHGGRTFEQRLAIRREEAKNTAAYLLGNFKEPERLKAGMMPDDTCESCHPPIPAEHGTFHGISAHRPKIKFPCIDCHASHLTGDPAYYFITVEKMKKTCIHCHPNIPGTFQYFKINKTG